jgi:hypothetical protein
MYFWKKLDKKLYIVMGLRDQVQMISLSPSIIIIKKAWRLIRNEILNMVNGIFRLGKLLKGVNISYVA